jgi:hypothetical protein
MRVYNAEVPLSLDQACVVGPEARTAEEYGSGYRQLLLRIDPAALRHKFEAFVGLQVRRASAICRSSGRRSSIAPWNNRVEASQSPVALKELQGPLLAASLCGHRHDYSFLLKKPAATATPKRVWTVESFIEANWNEPITVEQIADCRST